jgi:hypothetical protein
LSDSNVDKFANELRGITADVVIVGASSSDDVEPLIHKTCVAADKAGWRCSRIPFGGFISRGERPAEEGLKCYANDWNREDAARVKAAMYAVHLNCEYITGTYGFQGFYFGVGGVAIVIGSPTL